MRFSYKGIRLVTFKLKEQINIDDLIEKQHFEIKRSFKKSGKLETSIIKCKIRGLRSEAFKEHLARKEAMRSHSSEDGSVTVKVTGCEYKVSEEKLRAALTHWGTITSEIREELFVDPHDKEGTNRTGIYSLKMILDSEMPEIIPLEGLRVKIHKLTNTNGTMYRFLRNKSTAQSSRGGLVV